MSPYHYRLDWETWIRVTASLEQLWTKKVPSEVYHQQLPEFLQALVMKILNGDDDAAGLMGVPLSELYKGGEAPTAISIDFASYTFTKKNSSSAAWWRRKPVAGDSLRAYGRSPLPGEVRKSPRWRHWLLATSIMALRSLEFAISDLSVTMAVASGAFSSIFLMVLMSDYVSAFSPFAALLPLPPCGDASSVRSCQRCCYDAVWRLAAAAAGLGTSLALKRGPTNHCLGLPLPSRRPGPERGRRTLRRLCGDLAALVAST